MTRPHMIPASTVRQAVDLATISSRYVELRRDGRRLVAKCPFHVDKDPSLSIDVEKQLWKCFGCGRGGDVFTFLMEAERITFPQAVDKLAGETVAPVSLDSYPRYNKPHCSKRTRGKIVATYDYTDEHGEVLYQVCRFEPKDFRPRRPDGRGGWTWSLNGTRRVPYHLPEVLAARTVFIVEGEKDADALRQWGLTATTNPNGAASSKLYGEWRGIFAGKNVYMIPDNDEPGLKHAEAVAEILRPVARVFRVVRLPAESKDASDAISGGLTLEGLRELARRA